MSTIKSEIFDDAALAEQITLGKTVYSSAEVVSFDHIKWKHLKGPYGSSTVINIRDGNGILLGRSFLQPRTFFLNSKSECCGAVVTDLLINPAARNASTLIGMTRAIKTPPGIGLVVHTSNEVSDPIYRKLFKFPVAFTLAGLGIPLHFDKIFTLYLKNTKVLCILDYLLTPWRIGLVFFSKVVGLFTSVTFIHKPSDIEVFEIFNEFKSISGGHFVRNSSFLEWRFMKGPLFNGQVKWISSGGTCIGYLVFKEVHLGNLSVCVLMDVLMRRKLGFMEGMALKLLAIKYALDGASDALFTLVNINNSALKWLKGFPFISIPDNLLPHSTPIFIHASEEVIPIKIRNNIYLTLADLDYF